MHKNKFLTFLLAIIPGCGHMYLGYMKRGAQFMTMFAASFYFMYMFMGFWFHLDTIGVIFAILLPIIWFYQMFDAMHTISQMKLLEITVPEDDGFFIPGISNVTNLNALNFFKKRSVIKASAAALICLGIYTLFTNISNGVYNIIANFAGDYMRDRLWQMYHTVTNYVPPVIISLLLIYAGIRLLKGKDNGNKNNTDGGE